MRSLALLVALVGAVLTVNGTPLHSGVLSTPEGSRIIGGIETTIERFPYQAGIIFLGAFHCSGAIVRKDVIATAASCIAGFPPGLLQIFTGSSSRTIGGMRHEVRKLVVHEGFDFDNSENDIGLAFLQQYLEFSETVQPIPLASQGEALRPGTKGLITGWGTLSEDGNLPDKLHYAPVTIVERMQCAQAYIGILSLKESMICASGDFYGNTDPCVGDYGVPLVLGGKVYGFVSFRSTCTVQGLPRVYSNVGYLREWIDRIIG